MSSKEKGNDEHEPRTLSHKLVELFTAVALTQFLACHYCASTESKISRLLRLKTKENGAECVSAWGGDLICGCDCDYDWVLEFATQLCNLMAPSQSFFQQLLGTVGLKECMIQHHVNRDGESDGHKMGEVDSCAHTDEHSEVVVNDEEEDNDKDTAGHDDYIVLESRVSLISGLATEVAAEASSDWLACTIGDVVRHYVQIKRYDARVRACLKASLSILREHQIQSITQGSMKSTQQEQEEHQQKQQQQQDDGKPLEWKLIALVEYALAKEEGGMSILNGDSAMNCGKGEAHSGRCWRVGMAAAGSGAVLFYSGGLAAPSITASLLALGSAAASTITYVAPSLASWLGVATTSSAIASGMGGSTTAIGGLLSATGASLAGYKMTRLTAGVSEFHFVPLFSDWPLGSPESRLPSASSRAGLPVFICIPGWFKDLSKVENDPRNEWGGVGAVAGTDASGGGASGGDGAGARAGNSMDGSGVFVHVGPPTRQDSREGSEDSSLDVLIDVNNDDDGGVGNGGDGGGSGGSGGGGGGGGGGDDVNSAVDSMMVDPVHDLACSTEDVNDNDNDNDNDGSWKMLDYDSEPVFQYSGGSTGLGGSGGGGGLGLGFGVGSMEGKLFCSDESWEAVPAQGWWRENIPGGEEHVLIWETSMLTELLEAMRVLPLRLASRKAVDEAVKYTALGPVMTAAALPIRLLETAGGLDNPWAMAIRRSKQVGRLLAHTLLKRPRGQGTRPVTLLGYSFGARVICYALRALADAGPAGVGLVENAVLMGTPHNSDTRKWRKMRSVVAGRFINVFSRRDWLLGLVYRSKALILGLAGISPIQVAGVENLDLSSTLVWHLNYPKVLPLIMSMLHIEG